MKAVWNGKTVAQSDDTVVVEGNHYFPPECVDQSMLEASEHTTVCGWKGTANYYTLIVDGETNPNAAWYYANPKEAAMAIKGRVAFWRGVEVSE